MKLVWVAIVSLALCSCGDEPAPEDAENTAATLETTAPAEQIKEKQLSIEQAADEAVKLIEADAKAEIDANAAAAKN